MSERGRISVNAAYQLLAQAAVLAASFVASPIIVHGLGMEAYGILVIVGVTTNYFGFVELGLGRATVQLLGRHRARGEHADFHEVLWTSTVAYLVLSLLGGAALMAASPLLATRILRVSPALRSQAIWAFLLSAAGLVIALQRNVASSVATAMERFDLISKVTIGAGALMAIVNVTLVLRGAHIVGVILGGLVVQVVSLALYWVISARLVPDLLPPRLSLEKLGTLVRFGGYITVSQIVNPLLENVEKFLIGAFAAVDQLPYYSLPYSAAWALTAVPTSLVSVIYPAIVRLLAQDDHAAVRETVRRAIRYIFVVLVGPVLLLVVYAPEILTAWMGADFAVNASACLRILAVAVLVNVVGWSPYQLIHAAGRADLTARYHLIELLVHVPLSILLITRLGVTGAALAWLARVVLDTALLLRAATRIAGLGAWLLVREVFGRGLAVALALLPLLVLARAWLDPAHRATMALALGLISVGYVAPVVWLGLGGDERRTVVSAIEALAAPWRARLAR